MTFLLVCRNLPGKANLKSAYGEKSQDDPFYSSRWSGGPCGQRDKEHRVVLHDQGEEYQQTITPRSGSSKLPQGEVPRKA